MKLREQILSILVTLFLLCTVQFAIAEKAWMKVSESEWHAHFSDVFFVDAQYGWIVGSNSIILHTIDGGKTWNRQPSQPLPFDIVLKKVRFIDRQTGWVVGDDGTVLKTTDGGQTWMKKNTGTLTALLAVSFADAQHGWASGDGGLIIHTKNGGTTWTKQQLDTNNTIEGIHFVSPTVGWAAGGGGTLLYTSAGGQTQLVKITNEKGEHFNNAEIYDVGEPVEAVFLVTLDDVPQADVDLEVTSDGIGDLGVSNEGKTDASGKVRVTGNMLVESGAFIQVAWAEMDLAARAEFVDAVNAPPAGGVSGDTEIDSADNVGEREVSTWGFQTSATVSTLDAIFMLNDTVGWAVGAGGAIVATVNGTKWEEQKSRVPHSNGMPEPIWDVHFVDENVGIAAAEFGVILRTTDGGTTWTPLEYRPVASRLQGIHMLSPTEAWMVGNDATILHTTDGGDTWDVISSASHLRSVHFHDDNVGWAVGLSGSVLHTNDGGETWNPQSSGNVFELFGVGFVDENTGYIVGSNAALAETLDGGKTWHEVSDPGDEGHGTAERIIFEGVMSWRSAMGSYGMSFGTSTHAWAVGETGRVMHTQDAGQTWHGQDMDPMMTGAGFNNLYGVHFIDDKIGWIVGDAGTIAKTMDSGQTWSSILQGPKLNDVYAVSDQTAWIAGDQGTIMATTDGGATWIDQTVPTDANLNAVLFRDSNEGWAAGERGSILHTTDGGVTWLMQESPTESDLWDLVKTPSGQIWAVGDGTTIIRY